MKISFEWIKEYVAMDAGPEEFAHRLTMSGSEVEAIREAGPDKVMELEITPNRPDCLNILGLAREASAVFDTELKAPEIRLPEGVPEQTGPEAGCVIENPDLCPKYTARVITGVDVKPAGKNVRTRIEALGLRSVNNVVDVTNYCLMELGQPLHAFDLDRIKGGRIIVREAKKGEKIVTIDGIERELEPGMLVIADSERPIAIAGVMGGMDTEVSETTENILLESAYFDPGSVRRTARRLGLSTDSSYRFERGVDKGMITGASDRAAALMIKETGGRACGFYEAGALSLEETVIDFDTEKAAVVLGVELEIEWVERVLRRLGMIVTRGEGAGITVEVPSFRVDIKNEIDLTEEVARIFGYDRIPATMPKMFPAAERKEFSRQVKEKICGDLVSFGLSEIMTYSLISDASAGRFPALVRDPVTLRNPLSEEQKVLTPHLVDGMLKAVSWNINRKNRDLMLFEFGKLYSKPAAPGEETDGGGYRETPALCIGLTGLARENWLEGKRNVDFYDLKGIVEQVFHGLKIMPEFRAMRIEGIAPCAGTGIKGEKKTTGFLGQVAARLLKEYDIEQDVFVCQLELDNVFKKAVLKNRYHSVPRFPSSVRDISILCERSVTAGDIAGIIAEQGEELIRQVDLIDVYQGGNIPQGKKSLTYSVKYGLDIRTLREEEIEAVHSGIKDALAKQLGVTFR
ncbi:MAG: phenylalanine--tRNA ligase subunit beta [Candidatus Omnitrophica bacterium]|nr:phenylalanine--tRNA ligase subunit beta [Candidatus Omnitrophota bacterium]